MLSKHLRTISNRASKTFNTSQRAYSSFDRDFDRFTSLIIRDVDRSLSRRPSPWNFFAHRPSLFNEPTMYYRRPVHSHSIYEHKTITSDETGRVVVHTQRKVPGRPWETYVEEYANDNKLEQNKKPEATSRTSEAANAKTAEHQSAVESNTVTETKTATPTTAHNVKDKTISTQSSYSLSAFDQQFGTLSDSLMQDFDDFFSMRPSFTNIPRWFESEDGISDINAINSNDTYQSETVINNNGHVTVKTITKKPGSAWETTVKQYGKDGALEQGQQTVEAISDSGKNEQETNEKTETKADDKQKSNTNESMRNQEN